MHRRLALSAVVVVASLGAASPAGLAARVGILPLTVGGEVRMVTSPDGMTTIVLVDVANSNAAADGVVDHGFRLQHKVPHWLGYAGPGEATFGGGRMLVVGEGGAWWAFTTAPAATHAISDADAVPAAEITVAGMSHQWGGRIEAEFDMAESGLLSNSCLLSGGGCDDCSTGGTGSPACSVACQGGSDCEVACGEGMHACCTCPGSCRCCPDSDNVPTAAIRRP